MTRLKTALEYAAHGLEIFPCYPEEAGDLWKRPLTGNGVRAATTLRATIYRWWGRRWPNALIGLATGRGGVVLDIDVKAVNGFDGLSELGFAILPETPMAHTPSGGLHLYFLIPPGVTIRNTQGARGCGIGAGLDWRGIGGHVILPSPDSGYHWDPIYNPWTVPFAVVPGALLPRTPVIPAAGPAPRVSLPPPGPQRCAAGGSSYAQTRYAERALESAVSKILSACYGQQEATLNGQAFAIGTLAGAGRVPADAALAALKSAARGLPNLDPHRPWRNGEAERKVDHAFTAGLRHPRRAA